MSLYVDDQFERTVNGLAGFESVRKEIMAAVSGCEIREFSNSSLIQHTSHVPVLPDLMNIVLDLYWPTIVSGSIVFSDALKMLSPGFRTPLLRWLIGKMDSESARVEFGRQEGGIFLQFRLPQQDAWQNAEVAQKVISELGLDEFVTVKATEKSTFWIKTKSVVFRPTASMSDGSNPSGFILEFPESLYNRFYSIVTTKIWQEGFSGECRGSFVLKPADKEGLSLLASRLRPPFEVVFRGKVLLSGADLASDLSSGDFWAIDMCWEDLEKEYDDDECASGCFMVGRRQGLLSCALSTRYEESEKERELFRRIFR